MGVYDDCPICGEPFKVWSQHRCSESKLRAIDSTNRRLELDEEREATGRREFWRTDDFRLNEGLRLIDEQQNENNV